MERRCRDGVELGTLALKRMFPMGDGDLLGLATTAKIAGHPIHPMLIPFPLTFLVTVLLCDIVFWATGNPFWTQVAFWALA
jgi:uncharacterized membrane protein